MVNKKKMSLLIGALALAVSLWAVTSSEGGSSSGQLPVGDGHIKKVSPAVLRMGAGRITAWAWAMLAEDKSSAAGSRVCFAVNLLGPLVKLPNGGAAGPETGKSACRSSGETKLTSVAAIAMEGGSQTSPTGETTSWPTFDVGIAAYPISVTQVRMAFSDGGSELLKARAVPRRLAFEGAGPFHYVVFAIRGCAREIQGLERGHVLVRDRQPRCRTIG
jgi:hypothetical protein